MIPSRGYARRVRRTLRLLGAGLSMVGVSTALVALGQVPGFSLRVIGGSTDFNRALLLSASIAVGLLGVGMLLISARGIDQMAVTQTGIVFPIRSLGGMLRNRTKVVPFEQIVNATAIPTPKGRTVIAFRILNMDGQETEVAYAIEWAENPSEFEDLLSERIKYRRVRNKAEYLAGADTSLIPE